MQDNLLHINDMDTSSLGLLTPKRHQLALVIIRKYLHLFELFLLDQGTMLTFCSPLSLTLRKDLVVSYIIVFCSAESVLDLGILIVGEFGHGQAEKMTFVIYLFIVV